MLARAIAGETVLWCHIIPVDCFWDRTLLSGCNDFYRLVAPLYCAISCQPKGTLEPKPHTPLSQELKKTLYHCLLIFWLMGPSCKRLYWQSPVNAAVGTTVDNSQIELAANMCNVYPQPVPNMGSTQFFFCHCTGSELIDWHALHICTTILTSAFLTAGSTI